jgi:membrane protease YdiL (CAAX protease family)
MKTRKRWIFKDIKNILFVLGGTFVICSIFTLVMRNLGVASFWMFYKDVDDTKTLLYACVFAPIFEEVIFRWLPITLFALAINNRTNYKKLYWYVAAIISIVFAVAHYGYFSIFIQGILGMGLCYLYYKNRYGYISAVICHALWNISLGYVLPLVGNFSPPNPFNF